MTLHKDTMCRLVTLECSEQASIFVSLQFCAFTFAPIYIRRHPSVVLTAAAGQLEQEFLLSIKFSTTACRELPPASTTTQYSDRAHPGHSLLSVNGLTFLYSHDKH